MYTAQTGQLRRKRRDIKFIPREDRTPQGGKVIKIHAKGNSSCSGRWADIQLTIAHRTGM